MSATTATRVTVSAVITKPVDEVWQYHTGPEHITQWNAASDDWHCPKATNDLCVGGRFSYTMAAGDGSASFDFEGTYTAVEPLLKIAYTMDDDRKCEVLFARDGVGTRVTTTFDAENENPLEMHSEGAGRRSSTASRRTRRPKAEHGLVMHAGAIPLPNDQNPMAHA